jgi:hypothetical protein
MLARLRLGSGKSRVVTGTKILLDFAALPLFGLL